MKQDPTLRNKGERTAAAMRYEKPKLKIENLGEELCFIWLP